MFCKYCGNQIYNNEKRCRVCGNNISEKNKSLTIVILIIFAIILSIVLGFFGYIALSKKDTVYNNPSSPFNSNSQTTEYEKAPEEEFEEEITEDTSVSTKPTEKVEKSTEIYYVVNCESYVSLREKPSTDAERLKKIPYGDSVGFIEKSKNGFYKVKYGGSTGYVLSEYLSKNKPEEKPTPTKEPEKTPVPTETPKKQTSTVKTTFSSYTKHFGKTLDEINAEFEEIPDLQFLDGWLGVLWYKADDTHLFGFDGYGYKEAQNGTAGDSVLIAAQVPIWDIYPDIHDITNENGMVTKSDFENYIGKETELSLLDEDSEFSSPQLWYTHDDLTVFVLCDENGNINVDEDAWCQFH